MRQRRRRPRGPRPPQQGAPPPAGASVQPGTPRQGRRRRRRGGNRPPSNVAPAPYSNHVGMDGGGQMRAPQGPPRQRRRSRGGPRGNGSGDRRRGLEILRDLQQVGVALDPTERLILEMLPGQGSPP